jgi:hypothetical protein
MQQVDGGEARGEEEGGGATGAAVIGEAEVAEGEYFHPYPMDIRVSFALDTCTKRLCCCHVSNKAILSTVLPTLSLSLSLSLPCASHPLTSPSANNTEPVAFILLKSLASRRRVSWRGEAPMQKLARKVSKKRT